MIKLKKAWLLVLAAVSMTQIAYASSSISTRVKVVEEKVRLHDKKIRDIKAQQEQTDKQLAEMKTVKVEDTKQRAVQDDADRKAAEDQLKARAIAAAKARQKEEAQRMAQAQAEQDARAAQAKVVELRQKRYAFP